MKKSMHAILIVPISIVLLLTGCNGTTGKLFNPNSQANAQTNAIWNPETTVVLTSSDQAEYLLPMIDKSGKIAFKDYSRQWVYGDWRKVKTIDKQAADNQLNYAQKNWQTLYDAGSQWIYDCNDFFSWNSPPSTKEKTPIIVMPGENDKVIPPQKPKGTAINDFPSIYRQFFSVGNITTGSLKIWVNGSVDVYMDPPVTQSLVPNPSDSGRYYIGRAGEIYNDSISVNGITAAEGTALVIPKISPGTHCLYFVHRSATQKSYENKEPFFGLIYALSTIKHPSQVSDCNWPITEADCACVVSNENAEFLEAENDWDNTSFEPNGSPKGAEWIFGKWSPVSVINYPAVKNNWGVEVGGQPWTRQYNKGACWIYHAPHQIPNPPSTNKDHERWKKEYNWSNVPIGFTSVYRQTFSVDKESTGSLTIYTNDVVDVYLDPINVDAPPQAPWWFTYTPVVWQREHPILNFVLGTGAPTYYYLGRADKQTRGMKIDLQNLLTRGTHTLYFVHRNDTQLIDTRNNPNTFEQKPPPTINPLDKKITHDYYGLLYSLCINQDCPCGDKRDTEPVK